MFKPKANKVSLVKSLCYINLRSEAQRGRFAINYQTPFLDHSLPTQVY